MEEPERNTFGRRQVRNLMLQTCPHSVVLILCITYSSAQAKNVEVTGNITTSLFPHPTHLQVLPTIISRFSVLKLLP